MTRVVNCQYDEYDVYIGRALDPERGYFGSPIEFNMRCQECRAVHRRPGDTLPCYREWFYRELAKDPVFKARVESLRGKRLGCWCAPGPCHGQVIAEYLDEEMSDV